MKNSDDDLIPELNNYLDKSTINNKPLLQKLIDNIK